jgi:hypothetical protein
LRQWDYVHCPAGTRHVFVGGDSSCAIVMIGARPEQEELLYPVSEVAAKHGASVAKETTSGDEAYADWPGEQAPARVPCRRATRSSRSRPEASRRATTRARSRGSWRRGSPGT